MERGKSEFLSNRLTPRDSLRPLRETAPGRYIERGELQHASCFVDPKTARYSPECCSPCAAPAWSLLKEPPLKEPPLKEQPPKGQMTRGQIKQCSRTIAVSFRP